MRYRYALAGLAVAAGTGMWALPSASAGGSHSDDGDDHDGQVIRVMSREVDSADIDLGKKGFSLGDRFVFTDNLFMHKMRVGTDHGECAATRIQGNAATFQCVVTAVFTGKGQITVQGAVTFSENNAPFVLAVTGGTAMFRDAGGQVMVEETSGNSARLTFHLED